MNYEIEKTTPGLIICPECKAKFKIDIETEVDNNSIFYYVDDETTRCPKCGNYLKLIDCKPEMILTIKSKKLPKKINNKLKTEYKEKEKKIKEEKMREKERMLRKQQIEEEKKLKDKRCNACGRYLIKLPKKLPLCDKGFCDNCCNLCFENHGYKCIENVR